MAGRRGGPAEDDEGDLGALGPDPRTEPKDTSELDYIRHVLHQTMDSVGLLMGERQQARRERYQSRETARKASPVRPESTPVNPGSDHPPPSPSQGMAPSEGVCEPREGPSPS